MTNQSEQEKNMALLMKNAQRSLNEIDWESQEIKDFLVKLERAKQKILDLKKVTAEDLNAVVKL